jgi:hypothetical protein
MSANPYQWITDRPPTAADTSASDYWCVDIVDRSGPVLAMRWDDAEIQEFPQNKSDVIAWRPACKASVKTEEGAV